MKTFGLQKGRINLRNAKVNEKIKQLNRELARCENEIKRTPTGPAQEAFKARAKGLIKQTRMLEEHRDMLDNQILDLDEVAFARETTEVAQYTVSVMKSAKMELEGMMKNLHDGMKDLMEAQYEIQESLSRSFIPDSIIPRSAVEAALKKELGPLYHPPANEAPRVKKEVKVKKEAWVKKEAADESGLPTMKNSIIIID
ncbi:hypothetical protein Lser_V15G26251 [Lactuca serriola]